MHIITYIHPLENVGLHWMHQMQTIVTDDPSVCLSVCLSRGSTRLHCAKMAEQIKMLFGVNTRGGPRNIVLHGSPDPSQRGGGGSWGKFCQLWTHYISQERLKLEIWNSACVYRAGDPNENCAKVGHRGRTGSRDISASATASLCMKASRMYELLPILTA